MSVPPPRRRSAENSDARAADRPPTPGAAAAPFPGNGDIAVSAPALRDLAGALERLAGHG